MSSTAAARHALLLQVARDLSKVTLHLFRGAPLSRWPVDNSPVAMSCPAKLCFGERDVGNLGQFKDLDVGDEFTPADV